MILGKKELAKIQKDIAGTTRPSWHASLPFNFGSKSHGKVKADVWRSGIEFDLPVSIIQLWAKGRDTADTDLNNRRHELADSTMQVSCAIGWGTSHCSSDEHSEKYTRFMRVYIASVKTLFPHKRLKPNHYAALRLGEFLLRFGPVHGWWMFPFERVIGVLQKINTNNKMGAP